jgi:hypothetical protein
MYSITNPSLSAWDRITYIIISLLKEGAPKRRQGLENLSKKKLIKKCKNLEAIAQKAKEEKDGQ